MIPGDVFDFGKEGYFFLADKTLDDRYEFIKAVSDKSKPRKIYTPKYEKIIKAPKYSVMGCWANEVDDLENGDIDLDQTVFYIHEAKPRNPDNNRIDAYRFIAIVNPDGQKKVKVRDWHDRVFYLDTWHVIVLSHSFEEIKGTEFEKCKRCSALRASKHKPCNQVAFSRGFDNELSL